MSVSLSVWDEDGVLLSDITLCFPHLRATEKKKQTVQNQMVRMWAGSGHMDPSFSSGVPQPDPTALCPAGSICLDGLLTQGLQGSAGPSGGQTVITSWSKFKPFDGKETIGSRSTTWQVGQQRPDGFSRHQVLLKSLNSLKGCNCRPRPPLYLWAFLCYLGKNIFGHVADIDST